MSNEFVLDEKMSCDLVAYIRDNIAISELATANTQSIIDKFKQSRTPNPDTFLHKLAEDKLLKSMQAKEPSKPEKDYDKLIREINPEYANMNPATKLYTEAQVDELCKKAFNAAKEKEIIPQKVQEVMTAFYSEKYLSYEDFKKQQ